MLSKPVSFAYRFKDKYAMNIDHLGEEYRICWSGDWRRPPDLIHFPLVDGSVTPVSHSQEVKELWGKSHVLKCGADSHIRILDNREDAFSVCKVAIDDRQRRLIQDEFSILRYLASKGCPVALTHPEPLSDGRGIFGFMMEELIEIDVDSGRTHATQITSSIKQIHESGVVHYDLSPSNIMKNKEGRVTLIDFGRAGYLGDPIPPEKRLPNWKDDRYSIGHDMNALEKLFGIYDRHGCF